MKNIFCHASSQPRWPKRAVNLLENVVVKVYIIQISKVRHLCLSVRMPWSQTKGLLSSSAEAWAATPPNSCWNTEPTLAWAFLLGSWWGPCDPGEPMEDKRQLMGKINAFPLLLGPSSSFTSTQGLRSSIFTVSELVKTIYQIQADLEIYLRLLKIATEDK